MTSPVNGVPPGAEGPQIQRGLAPFDTGNQLLGIVPQNLTCSLVDTPVGQRLCATLRTTDATLTVFLAKDEAEQWVQVLRQTIGSMSGLIVPGT